MRWPVVGYGLLVIPLIGFAVFFIFPLLAIFDFSLRPQGILDLSGFARLISRPYYRETLVFTIWQALLSTALTIGLALPGAYVFTRYKFPAKSLILSLSTLPFVLPTVVVAAAFSALIGDRGLVNTFLMQVLQLERAPLELQGTLAIILIAHVFYNYAIALRMITGFWVNQSLRIEEAAQILGARGWQLWWYVRLPLLRPAILAAAVLVFIFSFTSFGVVLILGGIRFSTLEVQIFYQALSVFDLSLAAALSLVQIGIMFLMMFFYTRLQQRITSTLQNSQQVAQVPRTIGDYFIIGVNLVLMLILLFAPLFALVFRSFVDNGVFTVEYYAALGENTRSSVLFVAPLVAIRNSLGFAIITTLLATSLGLLSAYLIEGRGLPKRLTRWLDPIFMLPLATSAVTLGFGFIIAFDTPPLDLRASVVIIPIAHTLVAIPFVVRSVLPALRSIPPNLYDAASALGASPQETYFFIELPLISRGLIVGATFAFTMSMGEFGASTFVARRTPTMPLVIYDLLGQPGATNYGQALAMSALLMLVVAIGFVAIERVRTAGIGEF